jgi:cobaltochelatase CobS
MNDTLPIRDGKTIVTSSNRGPIRKWLTANGLRYAQISNLTTCELADIYNDITNAKLDAMRAVVGLPPLAADGSPPLQTPQTTTPTMTTTPTAATTAALEALLATLTPPAPVPAMDEDRIREMIERYAPRPTAVAVEIRKQGEILRTLSAGTTHHIFPLVLTAVQVDNVFISGPAGSGKTHLAEQCAEALNIPFYFTGAVASEYKLTGFVDAQGRTVRTAFREAFEFGGLFLFDEIDSSSPAALLAFNAALSNGKFDFPDGSVKKHEDFLCIASANTWGAGASREYVGRNQLDAATLNRFALVAMDYDHGLESAIAASHYVHGDQVAKMMQAYRRACRAESVRLVISPRNTTRTAKSLAAGLTIGQALDLSLCGLDHDTRQRLDRNAEITEVRNHLDHIING